jgi:two-component system response regulator MtrA
MADEGEARTKPLRILVADDNADLCNLWQIWLTMSGFIVDAAENGAEAVALALRQRPDVMLIDLEMPVMTGVEAIQRLRSDRLTTGVPIIVITAQSTGRAVEQARVAGADTYLEKPVLPEDLLQQIFETYARPREAGRQMVRVVI